MKFLRHLPARGMCDPRRPDVDQSGVGGEAGKQVALVRPREKKDPPASQQSRVVPMLKGGAQQEQVRLEDAQQGFLAGAVEQRLHVIAEPEPKNVEGRFLFNLCRVHEPRRFLARLVAAVEVNAVAAGDGERQRWFPGFRWLGDVCSAARQRLDGRCQGGVDRPQRRQVRQIRGVLGQHQA